MSSFGTLLLVSGSLGNSPNLHALDCSPKQSLPSAAEASHASGESAREFRSSPSMPSLSSCPTGLWSTLSTLLAGCLSRSCDPAHSCCFSGLAETSKANGSSHSQDHFVSLSQATVPTTSVISHTQKGKGTFTDDLLQLVDNFARDAISLSQCKRGPKNGATAVLGHDVSTVWCFYDKP